MRSPEQRSLQTEAISFRDLENKESVSPSELKDALQDYAESGSAINAATVNALIDRTELTESELAELTGFAKKGVESQGERGFPSDQWEYQKVVNHIALKLRDNQ